MARRPKTKVPSYPAGTLLACNNYSYFYVLLEDSHPIGGNVHTARTVVLHDGTLSMLTVSFTEISVVKYQEPK